MSKIIIYKASAGSGKTWQLTYEYLRILFSRPEDYRHILAVTFTNKATEEMRNRILDELRLMAAGKSTNLTKQLINDGIVQPSEIKERALHILSNLLHNFSQFTVTTIDSFFQRILKSFAREAGIPFYRELTLDAKMVLEETIDQLFFHLSEYPFLQDWLVNYTLNRIRQGKSWNVHNEVNLLGGEILKESYPGTLAPAQQRFSDEERKEWLDLLVDTEKRLKNDLIAKGKKACDIAHQFGLTINDFAGKSRSVLAYFERLANGEVTEPPSSILAACTDETKWYLNASEKKDQIMQAMNNGILQLLKQSIETIKEIHTIEVLMQNFYVWAILSDLDERLHEYLAEQNLHLLSDTHKILHQLIKENDAPFIYERAGNTWLYYMIDEFQDTSALQWNNFRPLIANGLGAGKTSLVVGDVKQSIYRWRNSDWRILAREIKQNFPDRSETKFLPVNRRSFRYIVEFNNGFFSKAIKCMKNKFCEETFLTSDDELAHFMTEVYQDCQQKVAKEKMDKKGFVRIEIFDANEEEWCTPRRLVETIGELFSAGYWPEDIAILVRTKDEAKAAASWLLNPAHYSQGTTPPGIITEEAILLNQSPVVRVLCSLLRYLINPHDQLNNLNLLNELYLYLNMGLPGGKKYPPITFTKEIIENFLPPEFVSQTAELKKLPLQILCGHLASLFGLDRQEQQEPYLFAFMDQVNIAVKKGISDVYGFLNFWDKKAEELSLTIPEKSNALRIMTIHKAKGLEFTIVILPDPIWNLDHNPNQSTFLWVQQNRFGKEKGTWFPIRYNKQLAQTDFREAYITEKMQTYVDNLNLLYVAFTRAREGLIVISGKDSKYYNARKLIIDVCADSDGNFLEKQEEEGRTTFFKGSIPKGTTPVVLEEALPLQEKGSLFTTQFSLLVKKNASEYFSTQGEPIKTARDEGKLMHALMAEIRHAEDVGTVVQKAVMEGKITKGEAPTLKHRIVSMLADNEMAEYFAGTWKIYTENDILLPGGETKRPDRIVTNGKETVVIDYKFGEETNSSHIQQVREYINLLKGAGFPSPRGIVWYPLLNRKERIA